MKKIILSITLLLFVVKSFSQIQSGPKLSKEYYLHESRSQKTIARILLVTGIAMVTTGIVVGASQTYYLIGPQEPGYNPNKGNTFVYLGSASALISIPFFISAKQNKKIAASITINNQSIYFPSQNSFAGTIQPAIDLKIELSHLLSKKYK